MKLWLLEWREDVNHNMHPADCTWKYVVRAESAEKARMAASENTEGDEGSSFWLDPSCSTCTALSARGIKTKVMMKAVR